MMLPAVGAEGVNGWAFITILPEDAEVHPPAMPTVNV